MMIGSVRAVAQSSRSVLAVRRERRSPWRLQRLLLGSASAAFVAFALVQPLSAGAASLPAGLASAASATADPFVQQGGPLEAYFKHVCCMGSETEHEFGFSVALSANGNTALIGTRGQEAEVGNAAWIFTRSGTTWTRQTELVPDDASGSATFGYSVALSANGKTALVGGIADNADAGAAWVFTGSGATWSQQGPKLTPTDESGAGELGYSVALSRNGDTALLGAPHDDGGEARGLGAAWVFARSSTAWSQQGTKLTGGEESGEGDFGAAVALAGSGSRALIGGPEDNSRTGAAWAFKRSSAAWAQHGPKITEAEERGEGEFGGSVAVSANGTTALIGAPRNLDAGGKNHREPAGAVWAFTRSGSTWAQQGTQLIPDDETEVKPEEGSARFGYSVALSAHGDTALIGGPDDNGETFGDGGVGAAWVFTREGSAWSQSAPKLLAAEQTDEGEFGFSVALSAKATTALIGRPGSRLTHRGLAFVFVSSGSG
jgi:FG-GAP repeat